MTHWREFAQKGLDPKKARMGWKQPLSSKPYWIPDDDCSMCMLCNSRFSLLNRRHHCRACGRVACGSCCKEKATLEYMKDDPKKDFSSLSLPNSPFLIALFLNDAEVPWAMACPNRLLFRLGLKYSWYPTPFVNIVGRQAVYSTETSQTVLKVFTDFRSWSFRMKHLAGSTVTLSNDVTLVEIPKSAKDDLEEIVSFNCKMLAWSTSTNLIADSHLVCDETNGVYSTQVLARGSTRKATGASFLIIDGGLKTNGLQISVVEDGVAIRIPSERLESLLQALNSTENWTTSDASGTHFIVRWTDGAGQPSPFGPVSPIDGQNLANKFQYGLSLERAISSVLQVNSVSDYGVRLSHVYNLKDGRLAPDDEPKVFSIAEMLARECTGMLEPYLTMLINMGIMSISVRVGVSADTVEYDVSPWFGMEEEQLLYKQNMDQVSHVSHCLLMSDPGALRYLGLFIRWIPHRVSVIFCLDEVSAMCDLIKKYSDESERCYSI
ncbi:FYVE zinc finger [Teladorsagia circumcincta]|uniref:FYVE zinc finger n=1 Tax=Teladorsagia circumcincta TaxID=45464 RepID=A0A2G9U737_TELCI|nr:FYVE zinc finger [Teladorsagia circumcincta]